MSSQYAGPARRRLLPKEGGAYLREQSLYSSQVTEWRKLRDPGVLKGKKAWEKIGKLSPE